jgi:hypothetical protein
MEKEEIKDIKKALEEEAPEFAKKVEPVYQALNWKWGQEYQIPDTDKILKALNRLIENFCKGLTKYRGREFKRYAIGSGGLEVYIQKDDVEDWEYGINLTIETRFRGIPGATYTLTTPHKEA